jgi:receptor protein-tyrosine kinase
MSSHAEVRAIRRNLVLVTVCTLLGILGAGAVVYRTTPVYAASADVFVGARDGAGAGGVYDRARFAQERIKSYVPLATGADVMQAAVSALRLPDTPAQLAATVTAQAVPETVLLRITARRGSAPEAQQVAGQVAASFASYIGRLEGDEAGSTSVALRVIRPASQSTSPVSPNVLVDLLVGLFLGLAVGLTAATLRQRWGDDPDWDLREFTAESVPDKAVVGLQRVMWNRS